MGHGVSSWVIVASEQEQELVQVFREGGAVGVIVWAERLVESRQPMAAGRATDRRESAAASSGIHPR